MLKPGILIRITYLVLSIYMVLISCNNDADKENDVDFYPYASNDSVKSIPVRTIVTKTRSFSKGIESNGKVFSENDIVFRAQTTGRITFHDKQLYGIIPKGGLIMSVDTQTLHLRMQKINLDMFNNKMEYESLLLGYGDLLKNKTRSESDTIRKKLRIASGLAASEQELSELETDRKSASVIAPFTGRLARIKITNDQFVNVGDELFRFYNPFDLIVKTQLLETEIDQLNTSTTADIHLIANPDIKLNASFNTIDPYVDENGLVEVVFKLKIKEMPSNNEWLLPGMNCKVTVNSGSKDVGIVVPREALVSRNGRPVIFTFNSGVSEWHFVTIAADNGKEVLIKDGLKPGEKAIISNNLHLSHGAHVVELNNVTSRSKQE